MNILHILSDLHLYTDEKTWEETFCPFMYIYIYIIHTAEMDINKYIISLFAYSLNMIKPFPCTKVKK